MHISEYLKTNYIFYFHFSVVNSTCALFEDIVCESCNAKVLDASSNSCQGSQSKFKLILSAWKKKNNQLLEVCFYNKMVNQSRKKVF